MYPQKRKGSSESSGDSASTASSDEDDQRVRPAVVILEQNSSGVPSGASRIQKVNKKLGAAPGNQESEQVVYYD